MTRCVIHCGQAAGVSLRNQLIGHETIGWSNTRPKVGCCKQAWVSASHTRCFFRNHSPACDLIAVSFPPPDFDPNLGMMAGITPLNPMMPGLGMVPAPVSQEVPLVKEIIHCKSCTLFPPNPSKSPRHANPAPLAHRPHTAAEGFSFL